MNKVPAKAGIHRAAFHGDGKNGSRPAPGSFTFGYRRRGVPRISQTSGTPAAAVTASR